MDTIVHLFDWLVSTTIRASWLTLAVLLVQVMLRSRTSARWIYALWLPVLIVLLIPAFPESSLSIGSMLAPERVPMPTATVIAPQQASVDLMTPAPEIPSTVDWHQVMMFTWLAGAVGVVLLGALSFGGTMRQIKQTRMPVSDAWLNEIDRLAHEIGLRRSPRVWMAAAVRSPAVTGFLRPTLLLPANFDEFLSPQETRLVLKHELTHIKRWDLPLNVIICLLLALHWFNPLLWLAFYKVRNDREAACDAQVLESESQSERIAYGHTLLKVENSFRHPGLSLGFVGIFQRGSALRTRIQSIANPPQSHPLMKAILTLSLIALTFLGVTKAEKPDADAPQILIQAKFIDISDRNPEPLPKPLNHAKKVPGIIDTFTDADSQTLTRGLSQRSGVDLLSAPSVITRSGQKAVIQVGNEFKYTDGDGKELTQSLGVTLEMLARLKSDDQLDLDLTPQIVEIEGMVKDDKGREQPVFKERKARISTTLKLGTTLLVELEPKTDHQLVQEKNLLGQIKSSKTVQTTRRLVLLVTPSRILPDSKKSTSQNTIQQQLESCILPSLHFSEATVEEAVDYFRAKSRGANSASGQPEHSGVKFILQKKGLASSPKINLQLKQVSLFDALKQVVNLADLQFTISDSAVLIGSITEKSSEPKPDAIPAQEEAASKIIFPKVEFHEASLTEAIEFIRVKSLALDPNKKGLNIVIKPGGDSHAQITLSLRDIPATEALRYCAQLASYQVSKDGPVFILTPIKGQ